MGLHETLAQLNVEIVALNERVNALSDDLVKLVAEVNTLAKPSTRQSTSQPTGATKVVAPSTRPSDATKP